MEGLAPRPRLAAPPLPAQGAWLGGTLRSPRPRFSQSLLGAASRWQGESCGTLRQAEDQIVKRSFAKFHSGPLQTLAPFYTAGRKSWRQECLPRRIRVPHVGFVDL